VHKVGNLQELYRDERSGKHKIFIHSANYLEDVYVPKVMGEAKGNLLLFMP